MKITTLEQAVTSVIRRAGTLQNDIQQVSVACLEHCLTHGDYTQITRLIAGIGTRKSQKSTALQGYFEHMMQATLVTDKAGELSFEYAEEKSAKDINIEVASALNWFDYKPAPQDNTKELEAFAEAFSKDIAKSVKTSKVTVEEQAYLDEVIANAINELIGQRIPVAA